VVSTRNIDCLESEEDNKKPKQNNLPQKKKKNIIEGRGEGVISLTVCTCVCGCFFDKHRKILNERQRICILCWVREKPEENRKKK